MSLALARVLVFVSGAAVLVVETLAARLVAPYVGLTLESHTAAIGIALLGIAAGADAGGRLADVRDPRYVVAGGLAMGGALVLAVRPIIHAAGPGLPPGPISAVLLIAVSTLAPITALSVVPVAVVRARLSELERSGRVVGSMSALGTIGALAGTFLTGFVFFATLPTTAILAVTATVTIALSIVAAGASAMRYRAGVALAALVPISALLLVDGPCDVETAYYCARVEIDPTRRSGRTLWLDDLRHSYVDLDDPTYLDFAYTRWFADAIDARYRQRRPLEVVHLGGGAFTMPRYIAATRPGSRSTVLEIDRAVVSLGRERLGLAEIPNLRVVVGDARTSLRRLRAASADLVIGDAFGGRSVPWHLATREFASDIERVLRPGGIYVLNVIDNYPNAFLHAEVATVAAAFDEVALVAPLEHLKPLGGGNFVIVAAKEEIDSDQLRTRVAARGDAASVIYGAQLRTLVRSSSVLTDDFAPVDQLLTPYPAR